MHSDNSQHLAAAAQDRHDTTRRRAQHALDDLVERQQPITIAGLARAAGVSRSWIYTQPDILQRVTTARNTRPPRSSPTAASEQSWKNRHDLAHRRITELQAENRQLREQLARAHGQLRTHATPS
ncbi:DUF6262 family protein [Gordonia sp. ABSL11-1]|uniref:DUF6262 family protein n=1 Tax=Gordonia sp. ABSL11-1 TaxID=3053924 RepID=UPI002573F30A|nr:DUF6262 family protein [Gordonia sp. ABSL11-1]MDL9947570.1 DUF6262 family protein [Gordonia sp. ABSL11-1]